MGECHPLPGTPEEDQGVRVRVEVGGEERGIVLMDDLLEWVQEAYEKAGTEIPFFYDGTEPSTGKDMVIADVRGLGPIPCQDIADAAVVALNDLYGEDTEIVRLGKKGGLGPPGGSCALPARCITNTRVPLARREGPR